MKTVISEGNSLYVSFTVYNNFFAWKDGVYSTTSGNKAGGHAVAGIGYGTEDGKKYWLLQNSWGPGGSGVNGYVKFLRGSNLAGVEEGASYLIGWSEGGRLPVCRDGVSTGYSSGGQPILCSEANDYGLCSKESVKTTCQKSCQSCPGVDPPPPPPPPPAPKPGDMCVTAAGPGGCTADDKLRVRNVHRPLRLHHRWRHVQFPSWPPGQVHARLHNVRVRDLPENRFGGEELMGRARDSAGGSPQRTS